MEPGRIILLLLALLFSAHTLSAELLLNQQQARAIAERELNNRNITKYNFDDARFDAEENNWVLLYWQDMGAHQVKGIMVFVSNSPQPQVDVSFEE